MKRKSESPSMQAWRRFKQNKPAMVSSLFIVLFFFLAAFCYEFTPDRTPLANRTCLPVSNQRPGFTVTMLRKMENKPAEVQDYFSKIFFGSNSNDIFIPISNYNFDGTDIVVKEFSAAGDSTLESRYNIADVVYSLNMEKEIVERNGGLFFETTDGQAAEESISDMQKIIEGQYLIKKKFILGTDRFGRDVLSRLISGTRATIVIGFLATLLSLTVGIFFGFIAGIFRGWVDRVILWLINTVWSVPGMLLIAAITFTLGNGYVQVFIAAGYTLWMEAARLVRNKIFEARGKMYVNSATALGLSKLRIFQRHILSGIFGSLLVIAAANFCASVLIESGLSFLGIGMEDHVPSWGGMIRENFSYIIVPGSAYLSILPGLAIVFVSATFAFLVNGLRKAIDRSHAVSIV